MIHRLQNIQSGYVEIYFYQSERLSDNRPIEWGYVSLESIPTGSDFDKDEIYYQSRWCTYIHKTGVPGLSITGNNYIQIGRKTGYPTRQLAIRAMDQWVNNMYKLNGTESIGGTYTL